MASGPYWDARRGTWSVQYWDGGWHRVTVIKKQPGWKPDQSGKTPRTPPEAQAALAKYAAIEQAARLRGRHPTTELLASFLEAHLNTYVGRSHEAINEAINGPRGFLPFCESRKIQKTTQVTASIAQEWADTLTAAGLAQQTVKNRCGRLAPAWRRAIRRQTLQENPWVAVEPRGKPARESRGSWTPEQFEKLAESPKVKPWLKDILVVGVYTGVRISALTRIEWSDIERPSRHQTGFGRIKIRKSINKTKTYRVPIGPKLHDLLAKRMAERNDDHNFIISGMQGRPTERQNVGTAILRACKRVGLPRPDAPNHHMRRTFGRWAVLGHLTGKPIPVYVVSRWLGHTTLKMTLEYLDVTEDDDTRFMMGED